MNATEVRKLCNSLTTDEIVLDQLNKSIYDAASHGKHQIITRIDTHHAKDHVIKSLKDNGFLVKCMVFTLNDISFYQYDINWEKYNSEEQNNKLAKQYS